MVKQYGQKDLNERSETLKRDQKARREKFKKLFTGPLFPKGTGGLFPKYDKGLKEGKFYEEPIGGDFNYPDW